jgi:hypothetical protein
MAEDMRARLTLDAADYIAGMKKVEATAQAAGAKAAKSFESAGDQVKDSFKPAASAISSLIPGLSLATGAVVACRVAAGLFAKNAADAKLKQVELVGSTQDVLDAQLEVNDAVANMATAIPFIGTSIKKALDTFSDRAGIEQAIAGIDQLHTETTKYYTDMQKLIQDTAILKAATEGKSETEILAMKLKFGEAIRQQDLNALREREAKEKAAAERLWRSWLETQQRGGTAGATAQSLTFSVGMKNARKQAATLASEIYMKDVAARREIEKIAAERSRVEALVLEKKKADDEKKVHDEVTALIETPTEKEIREADEVRGKLLRNESLTAAERIAVNRATDAKIQKSRQDLAEKRVQLPVELLLQVKIAEDTLAIAKKRLQADLEGILGPAAAAMEAIFNPLGTMAQKFAPAAARASGGWIYGESGRDRIPAWLTSGEFVVNRTAADANRGLLEAINRGMVGLPYLGRGFASGGPVGGPGAVSNDNRSYNVSIGAGSPTSARNLARQMLTEIRRLERRGH